MSDSTTRRRERPAPPSTRYQGSKLKLLPWIGASLQALEFETVLDAFGGSGSVAHLLKAEGKAVTYNDILPFNHQVGLALVENPGVRLSARRIRSLTQRDAGRRYDNLIERAFGGIYFTDAENRWLDVVAQNIATLECRYERAVAYYALFQACLIKRPYNLFHRKNLYMRTAEVARSFGNKRSWDTPFETFFPRFAEEANASLFESDAACRAVCGDAVDVVGEFDLVYIDPPYLNRSGTGVDYGGFYHFLDGLVEYSSWESRINWKRKHRPLRGERSAWSDPRRTHAAFTRLFERHARSQLVLSYRSDGMPTIEELTGLLGRFKRRIQVLRSSEYQYALSKNGRSREVLIIAT